MVTAANAPQAAANFSGIVVVVVVVVVSTVVVGEDSIDGDSVEEGVESLSFVTLVSTL